MTNPKTVLVTVASRGIGRAIARRLALDGFRVGIHYNSNHKAAEDTLAARGEAIRAGIPLGRMAFPEDAAPLIGYSPHSQN